MFSSIPAEIPVIKQESESDEDKNAKQTNTPPSINSKNKKGSSKENPIEPQGEWDPEIETALGSADEDDDEDDDDGVLPDEFDLNQVKDDEDEDEEEGSVQIHSSR